VNGPVLGYAFGGAALLGLTVIAWRDSNPRLAWSLLISGSLFGWIVGILLTPEAAQASRFADFVAAIFTFISGYVFSKLDRLLEKRLEGAASTINAEFITRLLVFFASMMLGIASTFIWRTYVSGVSAPAHN
jgi:hypothetical protein